jgi:peptide methionine sulfoxide reductase MsrA
MTAKTGCAIFWRAVAFAACSSWCGGSPTLCRPCRLHGRRREATYHNHGTHSEAIEIVFDPDTMTFRNPLEFFFQIHDPTTSNRQGPRPRRQLEVGDLLAARSRSRTG